MPPAQAESLRVLRGDVDEDVVQDCGVEPVPDELTEHRESNTYRRVRTKQARIQEREDPEQDDSRGAERIERDDEPAVFQPPLHASEERGVDPRKDEEDGKGGEQREELRALPEGSDEERLDPSGDSTDDEVHRNLREEDAEAQRPHDERDNQACAAREHPGAEPVPWKPSDE